MNLVKFSIRSAIVGAVVALLPFVAAEKASAYGYYHYVAWDTYKYDVWPSGEPIKRMYWHHTAGGFGASIKCEVDGIDFGWIWVPLTDEGWGGFSGSTSQYGYELEVLIVRFNGQSGQFTPDPIGDPYAWTGNAYVAISLRRNGISRGFAEGVVYQRPGDQAWW